MQLVGQRRFLAQIAAITVIAIAASLCSALWLGTPMPTLVSTYSVLVLATLIIGGGALLFFYILWLAVIAREPDPARKVKAVLGAVFRPEFLALRIGPIFLTFGFLGAFTTLKTDIPTVHPFAWDRAFSDLDRLLFGTDPWRLTHAVLGAGATRIVDFVYMLWLPAFWATLLFFSVFASPAMQRRFILSFFAIWTLLGLVAATAFSSAGPCFLALLGNDYAGRYADLCRLANAPDAARAQHYLAQGYLSGESGIARGISAMPSIHVALTALYVCAARHYGRSILCLALLFYLFILVGSVHLGWHYAVDGLFGTVGASIIWRFTRPSRKQVQTNAVSPLRCAPGT